MKLITNENKSLSLIAESSIPSGSQILEVKKYIPGWNLMHLPIMRSELTKDIFSYVAEIQPDNPRILQRLNLGFQISYLLRDRGHPMYDYVDSWPTTNLNHPVYWPKDSTLSPNLQSYFGAYVGNLKAAYDKIFTLEKGIVSGITFDEFVWCLVMSYARSVETSEGLCLIPMIDTVDHSFKPNSGVYKSLEGYELIAEDEIQPGTELTRNYGNLNQYEMLTRHGIFDEKNPYNCVLVYPEYISVWQLLTDLYGLNDRGIIDKLENPNGFSIKSLKIALYKKYKVKDLTEWQLPMNPPYKDMETAFRIFTLKISDYIEDKTFTSVEQFFNLDFTKKISDINEERTSAMIFRSANFYRTTLEGINMEGTHPTSKRFEALEKTICSNNEAYYWPRAGRIRMSLKEIEKIKYD